MRLTKMLIGLWEERARFSLSPGQIRLRTKVLKPPFSVFIISLLKEMASRKYLICHVLCHVSWYFQVAKNPIRVFQIQRFSRVGPTLGGGIEPGGADRAWPSPRPVQRVIFSAHWPKSDLVCEISIPRDVGPARPASLQPHWSFARPGPWDSQNTFAVSSCCVSSSSRFRGSNVIVSPRPAASLGSRSLSTIGIRSSVCYALIPAFGYRWCGVGYVVPWSGIYRATTKCRESWFYFSVQTTQKLSENLSANHHEPFAFR